MKTLFLFPTMNELNSIAKWKKTGIIYQKNNFYYTCCGVGKYSIQDFVSYKKFCPIIIGYGGALHPKLKTGDVIVSNSFVSSNGTITFSNEDQFTLSIVEKLNNEGIQAYHKNIFTSSSIISLPNRKEMLHKENNAWVVDMEGYWLADKLDRLISIRVILDTCQMELPDLSVTLKANGQISLVNTLLYLLKYPKIFPILIKIFFLTKKIKPILKNCCYLS